MSTVAVILAEGFEEVEAVTPIDFLRRAGIEVVTVGLTGSLVTGAHGIPIKADVSLEEFPQNADGIVIPGGMPGAANIAASSEIRRIVQDFDGTEKLVSAICAAPALVLGGAGVLKGRSFTCYPGFESQGGLDGKYTGEQVVRDGHLITGNGPGGAAAFAGAVIAYLKGEDTARKIMEGTLQIG